MHFLIILIAPPGSFRHGLFVLLTALETTIAVKQFDTIEDALGQSSMEAPKLIVFDAAVLGADQVGKLEQMQDQWPEVQVVALVNDKEHEIAVQRVSRTLTVGAGMAAARLRAIFNDLLHDLGESLAERPSP